jgi:hypothetical protein
VNSHTAQIDDLRLIALPSAVNCADLFVRFTLGEWSLHALRDEAANAVCELVTAAVDGTDPQAPGFITVRLRLRGDHLGIEVEDDQPGPAPDLSPTLAGGRAGVEARGRGKLVWCELTLPSGVEASAVPLPRRDRKKSSGDQNVERAEVDPQVMERILSGLGGSHDRSE